MVRWIVLVFCSIGLLMTGCDGSNCANPNPDYDPTDPTSESCLVVCEAGTYRCSQSNLERCKDDGSGYEFVTACPAGEACFQGTCIDESRVPAQTLIEEEGHDHEEHDHAHEGDGHEDGVDPEDPEEEEEGDEHAHEGEEHAGEQDEAHACRNPPRLVLGRHCGGVGGLAHAVLQETAAQTPGASKRGRQHGAQLANFSASLSAQTLNRRLHTLPLVSCRPRA